MSSLAKPTGAMPVDDPFTSPTPASTEPETNGPRQRYSGFGSHHTQNLAISSASSPHQLKRALEAHIAETERRLKEASHVGTVLLKQRQELNDRLKDLEKGVQDDEQAIAPEMRKRLTELEREFAETSRETAKIFVPKSRVPSGESDAADPLVYTNQTSQSPSKIQPPSRKLRNQPQSRINDVKLAAEISESLLAQVRQLQAACAEKEDALKRASGERDQLEVDLDTARVKIRTMDQEEQRYREENWVLETQVQDLNSASRAAAERERKLTSTLATVKQEKLTMEKEHEELRAAHGKLTEEHAIAKKHHDAELGSLRRDMSLGEAEVATLKKKVDDLTAQNKELAMAMAARLQAERAAAASAMDADAFGRASDDEDGATPEPSPPPSPSKATPRHGGLESETLKSSLHHAQRMIQHLKNSIHREKTEKFELRRLLQEARDEVDEARKKGSDGKRKNGKQEAGKKTLVPKPDRLGAARSVTNEIVMEGDPEWEDHDQDDLLEQPTPSKSQLRPGALRSVSRSYTDQSTDADAYITATENSDAFETANENASNADNETETEAFQTTAETLDGSDGDVTETESSNRQARKRPMQNVHRYSMQSTASTSDEEPETPAQAIKQCNRGSTGTRQSTSPRTLGPAFGSDSLHSTPTLTRDSPASVLSGASGTPSSQIVPGRSLFAELDGLSDGESEQSASAVGTPASQGKRSVLDTPDRSIPGSLPGSTSGLGSAFKKASLPSRLRSVQSVEDERPAMQDAGTMTEPQPEPVEPVMLDKNNISSVIALPRESTPSPALEPLVLTKSRIFSTSTEPVEPAIDIVAPEQTQFVESNISSKEATPTASPPPITKFKLTRSAISGIVSKPKDSSSVVESTEDSSQKQGSPFFGGMFRRKQAEKSPEPIVVAEDPVSDEQSLPHPVQGHEITTGPEGRIPFKAVDGNAVKTASTTANENSSVGEETADHVNSTKIQATTTATQTMLSAKDIDTLFDKSQSRQRSNSYKDTGVVASLSPKHHTHTHHHRRPGSSGSNRSSSSPPPPLPAEAKQVIAAAAAASATTGTQTQPGSMGPPLMPASAYNKGITTRRPKTPVGSVHSIQVVSPTKHSRTASLVPRSGVSSPVTRRSSVTSFASEIDARFNLGPAPGGPFDSGATDPRLIRAITQTMIGEFLWKYTRRTGGGLSSTNRHRRYFWVHPYTRTLYWSNSDPTSTLNRAELRAKSAPVEAVNVVTDPNPNPAGLFDHSILIRTTGRQIKLTAVSRERHDIWANALRYLLLKTEDEDAKARADEPNRMSNLTEEEVEGYLAPRPPASINSESRTSRSRFSTASLASRYGSTMGRHASPTRRDSTIRNSVRRSQSMQPQHSSISSRFSSIFRTPSSIRGSVSSRYEMSLNDQDNEDMDATPKANPQHQHTDGIENVRACCDGKHDVGSVPISKHSHHASMNSLSNTINSNAGTTRAGKRASVAPSVTTSRSITHSRSHSRNHSRRQSEDRESRRSQSLKRNGLMEMDPANIVG